MRFYAERPGRVALQVLADLLVIGWVVLVVDIALAAQEVLLRLQGPGEALVDAGGAIRGSFDGAARTAREVPFIGDALATALGGGVAAGDRLAAAGQQQVDTVAAVALGNAVGIVVLGAVPVVLVWAVLRVNYARAAGGAIAARGRDADLLALRALSRRPVRRLLRVGPDPAGAWRAGNREAVARLAALELASLGLRVPR
jgi:hypothetical protein